MAAGVSILSDLPYSVSAARGGAISREMETGRRDQIYCIVLTCLLFYDISKMTANRLFGRIYLMTKCFYFILNVLLGRGEHLEIKHFALFINTMKELF